MLVRVYLFLFMKRVLLWLWFNLGSLITDISTAAFVS